MFAEPFPWFWVIFFFSSFLFNFYFSIFIFCFDFNRIISVATTFYIVSFLLSVEKENKTSLFCRTKLIKQPESTPTNKNQTTITHWTENVIAKHNNATNSGDLKGKCFGTSETCLKWCTQIVAAAVVASFVVVII